MIEYAIKFALAVAFSGFSALIYRLLAKGRKNVRRESVWIFLSVLLFAMIRLLFGGI